MIARWLLAAALVMAAGCGFPQPRARIPSSGNTSDNGGADAELGMQPRGVSNFPYSTPHP